MPATVTALVLLAACSTSNARKPAPSELAEKISSELYTTNEGVAVPGILNGSVEIDIATVSGNRHGSYKNPVVLEAKSDNPDNLDGTWIGIPGSNAQGHVVLTPVQIQLGKHGDTTESLDLVNLTNPVLQNASVYTTTVTGAPDQLIAFDSTGEDAFPGFAVTSSGMK